MRRCHWFVLLPVALLGCNEGLDKYPTAKVTGKVMCMGKPVPNVRVVFAPMEMKTKTDSGKPGEGFAGADGSFTLSTYGTNDGAVIGKHEIRVDKPPTESDPNFKCDCGIDPKFKLQEVEVKASGENNFTVGLLPKRDLEVQKAPRMREGKSKDELEDEKDSAAASK